MKQSKPLRLVILISGYGSNLQAIIDAITKRKLAAEIVAVISDNENAYGLTRARQAGLPTITINPKKLPTRDHFDQSLQEIILPYQPDLIVLAGFMRIIGRTFLARFPGQIINIHPSLLPKYKGLNTHQRILSAGEREHGISIHFVTEDLDGGPVIAQAKLQVEAHDTLETLKQRIQNLEHRLYPQVINWFCQSRIKLTPQGIILDNKLLPEQGYQFNPSEIDIN